VSVVTAIRAQRAINMRRAEQRFGSTTVTTAADFLRGGAPTFARAFNRRGALLTTIQRAPGEAWAAFRARGVEEAGRTAGASSLLIGGLPDAIGDTGGMPGVIADMPHPYFQTRETDADGLPRGAIVLREASLHPSQVQALDVIRANRRVALVCGRRWGKSTILITLAVDGALSGKRVGVFAPTFQLMSPLLADIAEALQSVPGISINRSVHEIRLPNGGHVDFWSVDHSGRAGRGRGYHRVLLDESAHDGGYLTDAFPTAIAASLLDYGGSVVTASTPNGLEGWFHDVVHDQRHGFAVFHAKTSDNQRWTSESVAELRATMPRPEVALQELDAQFIDTGGATIFPLSLLLIDGEPHPDDFPCQAIGLAIDSNSGKGGEGRDGCAAVIFAVTMPSLSQGSIEGSRVVLLDWDIQSLAQGGVAPWMQHMRDLAMSWFRRLRPLSGPPSAYIEPAGNGYAVIEAARAQGLNPREIESKYVVAGKDGRALMAEPHATGGRVKIGRSALDKRSSYGGMLANHLTRQLTGFRAFDKDAYRREDDLFDAATYSMLVSLGDGTEMRWSKLKRVV
jgi:hypothetical protein